MSYLVGVTLTLPSEPDPAVRKGWHDVDLTRFLKIASWVAVIGFTLAVFVLGAAAIIALF